MVIIGSKIHARLFSSEDGWSLCFECFEGLCAVFGSEKEIVRCSFKVETWEMRERLRGHKE